MPIMRTHSHGHIKPGSDQTESLGAVEPNPICIICCNHPLALSLIKDTVCSDAHLRLSVIFYNSEQPKRLGAAKDRILILDSCSVVNWAECLNKWHLGVGP